MNSSIEVNGQYYRFLLGAFGTNKLETTVIDYISYDGCIRGVEGEDFTRRATGDVLVLLFARDVAGGPHGP